MKQLAILLVVSGALGQVALAKPALKSITRNGATVSVPKDYEAAVGERCISMDGPGSVMLFKTSVTQADFEKQEGAASGKKVARDKLVCFVNPQPGENARCMVTTAGGQFVMQFVSFGKGFTAIGGADAVQAIVDSVKGWDPKPFPTTYPGIKDCPVVK